MSNLDGGLPLPSSPGTFNGWAAPLAQPDCQGRVLPPPSVRAAPGGGRASASPASRPSCPRLSPASTPVWDAGMGEKRGGMAEEQRAVLSVWLGSGAGCLGRVRCTALPVALPVSRDAGGRGGDASILRLFFGGGGAVQTRSQLGRQGIPCSQHHRSMRQTSAPHGNPSPPRGVRPPPPAPNSCGLRPAILPNGLPSQRGVCRHRQALPTLS